MTTRVTTRDRSPATTTETALATAAHATGHTLPAVTVIVPTRNEAENIEPLLTRLLPQLPPDSEVLFLDDSDDETPTRIRQAAALDSRIRLIHRPPGNRDGGLGGAVLAGLRSARCE